ncbi:hypothetical protein BC629DRAFT_1577756 [Irpex lacteus]|nr:hypothetical protein BC629DRAFT_1577756 [Irpex lacteus]
MKATVGPVVAEGDVDRHSKGHAAMFRSIYLTFKPPPPSHYHSQRAVQFLVILNRPRGQVQPRSTPDVWVPTHRLPTLDAPRPTFDFRPVLYLAVGAVLAVATTGGRAVGHYLAFASYMRQQLRTLPRACSSSCSRFFNTSKWPHIRAQNSASLVSRPRHPISTPDDRGIPDKICCRLATPLSSLVRIRESAILPAARRVETTYRRPANRTRLFDTLHPMPRRPAHPSHQLPRFRPRISTSGDWGPGACRPSFGASVRPSIDQRPLSPRFDLLAPGGCG